MKVKNEHSDMLSAHQSDVESKVKSLHENHNDFQDNYKETIQNLIQDTEKNLEETKSAFKHHAENSTANEAVKNQIKTLEKWVRKQLSDQGDATIMVSDEIKKLAQGVVLENKEGLESLGSKIDINIENHEKETKLLLEKVEAIPASLQSQYMDAVVDMKDDIEKKFARLQNDVSSMQQSVTTTDSNDVQALIRRLEAIESALTSYDKHLSTFRSGLTDEIGAEVARQNIVIDTQKGLIEKIEGKGDIFELAHGNC